VSIGDVEQRCRPEVRPALFLRVHAFLERRAGGGQLAAYRLAMHVDGNRSGRIRALLPIPAVARIGIVFAARGWFERFALRNGSAAGHGE
jgi:hypothetical protein